MTARTGLANIILKVRAMTETALADYSVSGVAYWTDDQIQDELLRLVTRIETQVVTPTWELSGAHTVFQDYPIGAIDLEEGGASGSGVPYWSLTNYQGNEVDNTTYAVDYIAGVIRFNANTNGAIYFLKARSYGLAKAAASIWRRKMAHAAALYNFSSENQSFSRSQWFDHCEKMAEFYERQGGLNHVTLVRSDLF